MKKIIFLVMVLILLVPSICLGFPGIPLMVRGVEDCKVDFNGEIFYPESNYLMLSGKVGDLITVRMGSIVKVYSYTDPMEYPFLDVDMTVRYFSLSFIDRVILQLKHLSRYF